MSTATTERRVGSTALPGKIAPCHLERLAIVYVRQSTLHQVLHHQESTRLQYALTDHAVALGWSAERVLVIDDDLGRSGASSEGRPGFQRLVAEVGLDHVGLILGLEMSRLARSCRDWHHLLEVCALFGTLLADPDGLYDPSHYNDRLLLGLKGTMSEAELHILKQRMHAGKLAKARRGELGIHLPMGYVKRPSGEVVKDPDEQARRAIETLFEQFERRGTVHGVLCYLVEHGIQLPVRVGSGPAKGELRWHVPNRMTLQNVFHNPTYAGAYVFGRRPVDPRAKKPGRPATGRKVAHLGEWEVCLRDRLPAYIPWAQFEQNVRQLALNRNAARGVPRRGATLVAGLLRCGRCGHRMVAQYSSGYPRYTCMHERSVHAGPGCQSVTAASVDRVVEALVLRALEPASLALSLAVAADLEQERAREEQQWQLRRERARYEVERARRQYDAVEPENRLVARTLERALEERLGAAQALEEDYRRYRTARPTTLSDDEREAIRALATELPSVWNNPATSHEQRKAVVRQLVEETHVRVEGESERAEVTVRWAGGHETKAPMTRPVGKLSQLSYYADLLRRTRALRAEGATWERVAVVLNAEGWRPAKRRATFTPTMAASLISGGTEGRVATRSDLALREDEWRPSALADELGMSRMTLHSWITKGWVRARKVPSSTPNGAWAVWADKKERERLRALRVAPRTRWARPELTRLRRPG
jgi:DNA invertase Pin-like site-specific DNA recombinase